MVEYPIHNMTQTNTNTVTLKLFKHIASMSEETLCFTAAVYVNDKLVGYAENRGHGGCTHIRAVDPIVLHLATIVDEVDRLADELVNEKQIEKLRKKTEKTLDTTIVFSRLGDKEGSFRVLKHKFTNHNDTRNAAIQFAQRDPSARVLNLMPFEEAFKLLVKIV